MLTGTSEDHLVSTISATRADHPEPSYPSHWIHYELRGCLLRLFPPDVDRELLFRDLIVSHQTGFLGHPETVLIPADRQGQPLSFEPLRTIQDQHVEPAGLIRHYLTRHAACR